MRNLMKHMDKSEAEEKMRKEAAAKEAGPFEEFKQHGHVVYCLLY